MDGDALLERDVLVGGVYLVLAQVLVIEPVRDGFLDTLVGLQGGVYVGIRGDRLVFVVVADDVAYALGVDGQAGREVNRVQRAVGLVFADILIFKPGNHRVNT